VVEGYLGGILLMGLLVHMFCRGWIRIHRAPEVVLAY